MNGYSTNRGQCIVGDSLELLRTLEDGSVNLVVTSPPFALLRQKSYGNLEQEEYISWLCSFGKLVFDKLSDDGSFVIDLGAAYNRGSPTYSLYQFKVLIKMCEEIGFHLAQPFYWHNTSALPAPIEWVNKRKLRAKNSVNTVWWLSKTEWPKSNIKNVLTPYSSRMQHLINRPEDFVKEEGIKRPSGHVMGKASWTRDNGGAIPPNLLQYPNSDSNSQLSSPSIRTYSIFISSLVLENTKLYISSHKSIPNFIKVANASNLIRASISAFFVMH